MVELDDYRFIYCKHNYISYSIRESTAYKQYVVLEVRFKV